MRSISDEYRSQGFASCPVPHCTDLLHDPAGVLADQRRWPNHVCYKRFLTPSTRIWAYTGGHMKTAGNRENAVWRRWQDWWPLPIGRKSLERACIEAYPSPAEDFTDPQDFAAASNMMPGGEWDEALWALRIAKDGAVLDLFGLARDRRERGEHDEDAPITAGDMACSLRGKVTPRGKDTSLLEVVRNAEKWWSHFKGKLITGRPRDSGTWRSEEEFMRDIAGAITALRSENGGKGITQEKVADYLNCSVHTLRRGRIRFTGFGCWKDLAAEFQSL